MVREKQRQLPAPAACTGLGETDNSRDKGNPGGLKNPESPKKFESSSRPKSSQKTHKLLQTYEFPQILSYHKPRSSHRLRNSDKTKSSYKPSTSHKSKISQRSRSSSSSSPWTQVPELVLTHPTAPSCSSSPDLDTSTHSHKSGWSRWNPRAMLGSWIPYWG